MARATTPEPGPEVAREIIDQSLYMVLATADGSGRPWASPVQYATEDRREFFWVSRPEATHSQNLRERPELGIVIFDSTVPGEKRQAVYMSAAGREVPHGESEGLEVFSRRSIANGDEEWTAEHVSPPADLRLFRASVSEHFVLRTTATSGCGSRSRRPPQL
jgi:nitroimidazol reductase NimA-like FMN-containing flavoprotein (pyridoxamine 5'-phosphate oxidase superfamily)